MFVVGIGFFIVGLIFTFNPMGIAEKYIWFAWRMGTPRPAVSARYLARRLGIAFLIIGCGMLAARVLLALGVKGSTLMELLPVAVLALFAIVGSTIYLIYRASSRHDGG
ncbi:hypothetical protein [Streptomyces sp. NPDC003374]